MIPSNPAQMTIATERALKKPAFTLLNTIISRPVPTNKAVASDAAVIIVSAFTWPDNESAPKEQQPRNRK